MSQKSYIFAIIDLLLKNPNHIRGLAKELGTNQMTVFRKIKELYDANVVDFSQQGKNKVYFLKPSLEAYKYILITEHYKLLEILNLYPNIRRIIQKIIQDKRIHLAILFGSYAKRIANKDSDIDIFIETTNESIKEDFERYDSRLSIKIGRFDDKNLLIKEIKKNHVIIKGVEHYYERIGFFKKDYE